MIKDALWIEPPVDMGDICPEFYKIVTVKKQLKKAELSVTAAGVYEAYINGKRVGDFILAPGCTVYKKRLQYQTYEVTDMLGKENELAVCVGKGWYRGRISENSKDIHNVPCVLAAELKLYYNDGSEESIITDAGWSVRKSRILFSDIYDGEIYDTGAECTELGAAVVSEFCPTDTLVPQEGEIVCEHERIKPVGMFITSKGERVIDFGQNISGYISFDITAQKGERISLSHAEVMDKDGNFYTENYRSARARLEYICRDGKQSYKPHFTFFGFRYIRLDECPESVKPEDFTAVALYSDMERTGGIKTGNEKINRLFENTLWSQRDNFIDIPTDCPQRDERMGWLGDAQVFAKTAAYNYNVKRFFEKWMRDMRAEQRENGSIPDTVPNFWKLGKSSTAWGDAVAIIPWQIYLTYGDDDILRENFDAMKKWVDYITHDTKDKYLWTCSEEDKRLWGKHYGDWLGLDAPSGSYKGSSDEDLIASAFYANSVSLLVKAGKMIGKDMSEYENLYENIVSAFRKRFPVYKTQTEHVIALYFDLTENAEKTAADLAEMIEKNGCKMETGFVGTPYLLHVLSENGHTDTAYKLLLREEYPSWLYEVNKGATTIWEHWDGIKEDGSFWSSDMNSYNHYAYGSVIDWLYSSAAGINPSEDAPGYERVVIHPKAGRELGWISAYLDTAYGRIYSAWNYDGESVRYEIITPVKAAIIIDGKVYDVEKGSYIFYGKA